MERKKEKKEWLSGVLVLFYQKMNDYHKVFAVYLDIHAKGLLNFIPE